MQKEEEELKKKEIIAIKKTLTIHHGCMATALVNVFIKKVIFATFVISQLQTKKKRKENKKFTTFSFLFFTSNFLEVSLKTDRLPSIARLY